MSRATQEMTDIAVGNLRMALIRVGVISEDSPELYVKTGNSSYGYSWSVSTGNGKGSPDRLIVETHGTRSNFNQAIWTAYRALEMVPATR